MIDWIMSVLVGAGFLIAYSLVVYLAVLLTAWWLGSERR